MNKNWLYRVLAMALIVMMALPFAMAEEVEVQTNAVEEVVESNDVALEGDAGVDSNATITPDEDDIDFDPGETVEVDRGVNEDHLIAVIVPSTLLDQYYDTKSVKLKSSKSSVVKIGGSNPMFTATLKKEGEVTLKLSYKYKWDEDSRWHSDSMSMKLKVTDDYSIHSVKANYADSAFNPKHPEKDETKKSYTVEFGVGKPLIPFAANKDGESLDYMADDDTDAPDTWGYYTYKWSDTKIGSYVDGNKEGAIVVGSDSPDDEDVEDYFVVFNKKGTAKVTFTSVTDKDKKATITFKVKAPAEYKAKNSDKPKVPEHNEVDLVVKSAKFTKVNEAEVVVWVANGSGDELRGKVDDVAIVSNKDGRIFANGTMYFKGTIKKNKVGTATITFKGDELDPTAESDGQIRYKDGFYGKLFDLDVKWLHVDSNSVDPDDFNDCDKVTCNVIE
jgi:hypothetical protein